MVRFGKYILMMLLMVSCIQEETFEDDTLLEEVTVGVNLEIIGEDMPTRAVVDPVIGEATTVQDVIKNFWILQYDGVGDDARLIGEPQYYPEMTTSVKLVKSTGMNRIVVLANTFDPLMTFRKESDFADLKKQWKAVSDPENFLPSSGEDRYLMFNGSVETIVSTGTVISCPLKRNVARVVIKLINSSSNVTIESWQIRNVPSVSYIYTDYDLPAVFPVLNDFVLKDYPTYTPPTPLGPKTTQSSVAAEMEYVVYLPVNRRGTDNSIASEKEKNAYAPNAATCLQVNASYDGGVPIQYTFYLGANLTTDFNILPNHSYSYDFNITAKGDASADTRVKELGLVDFTGTERANCYVINPAQIPGIRRAFKVPVDRVDKFWGNEGYENNDNYMLKDSREWEVKPIAWNLVDSDGNKVNIDDAIVFTKRTGKGKADHFEFTVAPKTVGNVIVALYRAGNDKTVCWSWHLWITDYTPDEAYTKTPQHGVYSYGLTNGNGVVHRYEGSIWTGDGEYARRFIMDRNLGAWGTGYPNGGNGDGALFYQFGRKDPIFGKNATNFNLFGQYSFEEMDQELAMAYSVQNPLTFISTKSRVAWTKVPTYNPEPFDPTVLWQDVHTKTSEEKSLFDPCPPGYCVPKSGTWSDFRPQNYISFKDGQVTSVTEVSNPTTNVAQYGDMKRGFPPFLSSSSDPGCYYWPYNSKVPDEPVYYPACGVIQNNNITNHYGPGSHVYMISSNPYSINSPWLMMANDTGTQKSVGGNTGLGRAHAATVRCVTVRDV